MFIDYFVRRLRQLSQGMYKKVTYIRIRKFMIQVTPQALMLHYAQIPVTPQKGEEGSKYGHHSAELALYKEAEALGKLLGRFQFSMNQH